MGRDTSGSFRVGIVAVKDDDEWRLAHVQLSGPLIAPGQMPSFRSLSRLTGQAEFLDLERISLRPRALLLSSHRTRFYCCGNLFADGGVPGYTWTLRSGQLPPGLSLQASPGRITGTPTTRGTLSFLVRATDTKGAFAERTSSITVS